MTSVLDRRALGGAGARPDWITWLSLAGAASSVSGFLLLALLQLHRPLMYDDANFALAARAVAATGLPFGNQGWMSDRGDYSQQLQWALWHPPLYVYLEGLAARIGGASAPALRVYGLLGGLATAVLTFLLASDLAAGSRNRRYLAGAIAVAASVLSPLYVQSALILDIDFTVLLPLTLLFLLLYLRLEQTNRWWLLAPLFGLLLWAKMTNPLPLLGAILAWQALRGRPVRGVRHAAVIGAGGGALFGLTYVGIGTALGFPLGMPFQVNLAEWQDSANIARQAYQSPAAFIQGLQPTFIWMGPGAALLGLVAVALRVGQLARSWQVRGVDLVLGVCAALVLGYVNKSAGWFPKYQVPLVPLLCAVGAPIAAVAFERRPRLSASLGGVVLLVAARVAQAGIRDTWAVERTWQIEPEYALWLVGLVLAATLVAWTVRLPALVVSGLFALAMGWNVGVDAQQLRVPYATTYWYGTQGTLDAVALVDQNLAPTDLYAAAKEVAFQSSRPDYLDEDTLIYELSTGQPFTTSWQGRPLRAIVAWVREPYVQDLLQQELPSRGWTRVSQVGDYAVYEPAGG